MDLAADGTLSIREILKSEHVKGLQGVTQVVCSSNGKFIYTTSGRFEGAHAICAFEMGADKKLKLIHSLSNSGGELPNFSGGNKIRISPDGNAIYVTATNSNHIACLQRDAKSGKLTLTEMLDCAELPGTPKGPNGLAFSQDGKHMYVTWEFSKGVSPLLRGRVPAAERGK